MEENMQLPELRELAKERGLKNISKLKKSELIELLKAEEGKQTPEKVAIREEIKEEKEEKEKFVGGNRSI